jgi:hypothetical protein
MQKVIRAATEVSRMKKSRSDPVRDSMGIVML